MKNIGVTRKMDSLGRIVLPKELRRTYGLDVGTPIELSLDENQIILQKHEVVNECAVTGEVLPENKEYLKGIYLSPKGAEILLNQIL